VLTATTSRRRNAPPNCAAGRSRTNGSARRSTIRRLISRASRDFGVEGAGPVADIAELRPALEKAIARLKAGAGYVLDVVVNDE
jgi:hypothetical protein